MNLSSYERKARREIDDFKNPDRGFFSKAVEAVNKPIDAVGDFALDNKVGDAVSKAVKGIMELLNDGSSYTVQTEAVCEKYRDEGYRSVREPEDIRDVPLEDIEKVVGYLGTKYKSMGFAEGGAAGVAGAAGIAADIPALMGIALRAVNEYATYYGFDITRQQERAVVMRILLAASSPTQASKQAMLAQLTKISVKVAKKKTWKELQKHLSVKAIKKIAEKLGIRLTKAKLAQVVPVIGAGVGGGYNAWYVAAVTKTAQMTYRERYLIEKYGETASVDVKN
jgi:uncharacterized protein (DUF697 family)